MGTKQIGKRKYLFFHFACLGVLPFVIFGCLHFSKKRQGQQLLDESLVQMADRQYQASMTKSLAVLNSYPHSLADRAFYQIGLLYAHPENPNQNYEKSLVSFYKILDGFPESPLRGQARLWVLFIRDVVDKERNIGELNKKNISLQQTIELQRSEFQNLKKKIQADNKSNLIVSLEKKIEVQKKEINQLLDQIEKLKRVDLGIEEKKQKILQQNENIEEPSDGKNPGS